ncbi:complement factor H-related protein 2 isoform X2 [Malaclemys terrapin pileata]|uniref:complement factor H-related protein 2 isoform X2 n=1 Tax=Malaclemys terrapin pileata TaxID=2991368 RepID=UPI0023A8145A|nr:complement factor H-related protein 2 isoform X2 [Malaclemys terrapin pileata]
MTLLSCIIIQILWAFSAKGQAPACEEPPAIDFGGIVSDDKSEYREGDKVLYKCNPGYSLMGTEWITCSGKTWTPAPQCLETGKKCSRPPTIENGDITTFLEKGYTSGSFVEFKCQKFYAMEGQNRSFCDDGNWTKAPLCLEPCAISVEEMENRMVELNGTANENILQWVYLKRGDFLELHCKPGYALATNLSQSTFMVQCNGNPIVYPECKEIVCDPPGVVNGRFRPQRNVYRNGDVLIITCNHGFQDTAECTKNGWLPSPRCSMRPCDDPHLENGELSGFYQNYKEQAFPARLGSSVYYRCFNGYVSKNEERWTLSRCTKEGWDPMPKCLRKCSLDHLENGRFLDSYWKRTYKEGDEISYVCDREYSPENMKTKATCTKNDWSPTPRCIFKSTSG